MLVLPCFGQDFTSPCHGKLSPWGQNFDHWKEREQERGKEKDRERDGERDLSQGNKAGERGREGEEEGKRGEIFKEQGTFLSLKYWFFHFKLKPNINIGKIGCSQNWWEFTELNKMNAWLNLTATYLVKKREYWSTHLGHHLWITIVWNSFIVKSLCVLYFVCCKGLQTLLVLRNGVILEVSRGYMLICNIRVLGSCLSLVAES